MLKTPILGYHGNSFWELFYKNIRGETILCTKTIGLFAQRMAKDYTFKDVYL
jgi:hypothetical protein